MGSTLPPTTTTMRATAGGSLANGRSIEANVASVATLGMSHRSIHLNPSKLFFFRPVFALFVTSV